MMKLSEKYNNEKNDKKKHKLAICESSCDYCEEKYSRPNHSLIHEKIDEEKCSRSCEFCSKPYDDVEHQMETIAQDGKCLTRCSYECDHKMKIKKHVIVKKKTCDS